MTREAVSSSFPAASTTSRDSAAARSFPEAASARRVAAACAAFSWAKVCGRILGIARGRLLQSGPQGGRLLSGLAGERSRRFQLVGAPDLPQDAAPFLRLVLHQQAGEAALGQHHGAQKGVAVEPDQLP